MNSQTSTLKSHNNHFILLVVATIVFVLLAIMAIYESQLVPRRGYIEPRAEKGVFDFTPVDFSTQTFVPLKGEVEFYWNALLSPEDFEGNDAVPAPVYVGIPHDWNNVMTNGERAGAFGYATYRFRIRVNTPGLYGLKIKEFESAFRIYINSVDCGGAGKVGTSKKDMIPSWQRQEYTFYVPDGTVDVILQISNFQHRLGGASEIILFGSAKALGKIKATLSGIETFLLGLLIILSLYHFTLYHFRRDDKSTFYFALTSMFLLLRLSTTGEKLLVGLFSFIPWEVAIRIEYLSLPLIGLGLTNFVYLMLPENIPLWFKRSINIIATALCGFIVFLPASIFTYSIYVISASTFYLVAALFIFLLKANIQKRKNAHGLFMGFLMIFLVMVNDVLCFLQVINFSYLLPFGLLILLLTQAFIISKNSSMAYTQVETLSKELEKHAEELEELVSQRTKKLQERNSEIELQKNKIENQATILDQTNRQLLELVNFKKEMTRMMVHDLKTPLSNIIGFMQLPEITDKIRHLITISGNDMQNLIQNILDVAKYDQTKLEIHPVEVSLNELIDMAYHQNEYGITLRNIRFENLVSSDVTLHVDKDLITRVLTNIISNATKYRNESGLIRISSETVLKNGRKICKVSIFNTGESIPEDKLEIIFDIYNQIYSPSGEYKYSSGIGLSFCKMAIEAHGGRIGAVSKEEGTTFWFELPIDNNE